jgi:hypothetical protein
MRPRSLLQSSLMVLVAGIGCSRGTGSAACGIAALTGPLAIKQSFSEGNALSVVPEFAPATLPVRLVAGPVWRGTVTPDSTGGWTIQTKGAVSRLAGIGYGVLVVNGQFRSLGVLIYEGRVFRGGLTLGHLMIRDTVVPLLGVRIDNAAVTNGQCPLFPDSLR